MGNIIIDETRNKKLIDVIYLLSDPNLSLKNIAKRREIYTKFEEVYWQGEGQDLYRHLYSDLFDVIIRIDQSDTNDVEILIQNIQTLCLSYDHTKSKIKGLDIGDSLIKLYDHISLDVKRLQYTKAINYEHKRTIFTVAKNVTESEKNVKKEITETVKDVRTEFEQLVGITKYEMQESNNEELSKMRGEYISILGIFASIVLAFIGGMTFSTSVLNNIHNGSIYRLLILASLIGMIFIVMIWLLMDFIKTIHGQTKRNYWYILIPEVVLVAIMAISFLAYRGNWFEGEEEITNLRSLRIEQEMSEENSVSNNNVIN